MSEAKALVAESRLYDRLFKAELPGEAGDFVADLNPASLQVVQGSRVEPALASLKPGETVQFERVGYFCLDPDSKPGALVFNRTIGLRDSWAASQGKG